MSTFYISMHLDFYNRTLYIPLQKVSSHSNHPGKRKKEIRGGEKYNAGFYLVLRQQLQNTQKTNCNFIKYDHPV
jgi:hypothetical protein